MITDRQSEAGITLKDFMELTRGFPSDTVLLIWDEECEEYFDVRTAQVDRDFKKIVLRTSLVLYLEDFIKKEGK